MKKIVVFIFFVFMMRSIALGQDQEDPAVGLAQNALNETDKMKSGNTKEVQNNFLQASLNNIFGPKNSFSINPSLFAIDSLFSKRPRKVNAETFRKQRLLRNIQLVDSISISNPDNSLHQLGFSKLSFGVSIAVINNKDVRYGTFANDPKYLALNKRVADLWKDIIKKVENDVYYNYLKSHPGGDAEATKLQNELSETDRAMMTAYWIKTDSNVLSPDVRKRIALLPVDDAKLLRTDTVANMVKILAARYSQRALWTVYPAYAYDVETKQSNWMLTSEYTKGIRKDKEKAAWELDLKASMLFGRDTTMTTSNLNNQLLVVSAGLNFILCRNKDDASMMELKPFFQNNYQFGNVQNGGHRDSVTANIVYRIKVFNSFWIPLTISYDINKKDHPLFGFISFAFSLDSDNGGSKKAKK